MPGPGALAMPSAVAAAKHMAFKASLYAPEAVSTVTSATAAALLARWMWKRIPIWIKQDISFRTLMQCSGTENDSREELSHLGSVLEKLQQLLQSIEQANAIVLPDNHFAAIVAYIQLAGQLKQQQLERLSLSSKDLIQRDSLYHSSGRQISMDTLRSNTYKEALLFSTFAYYKDTKRLRTKLKERGYNLEFHRQSSRPGNVAYFVAVSYTRQELLIGVRGTSSLEDIVTDCCGRAVPFYEEEQEERGRVEVEASKPNEICFTDSEEDETHLEVEVISGHERIRVEDHDGDGDNFTRCHEGILISAKKLVEQISCAVQEWGVGAGYQVLLCGHSLGAGAATLAGHILRTQFPNLQDKIAVQAIAPPPVLDHDSAIASASFVTSIVHNADMIPRCSLYNLAMFLECLRHVRDRLVERGMNPIGPRSTATFVQQISQGLAGDVLLSTDEFHEIVERAHSTMEIRKPEHLFVAGKVLLVYSPWSNECPGRKDEESLMECHETDGAAAVFRTLEVDGPRLFSDHILSSYFEALGMDYKLSQE